MGTSEAAQSDSLYSNQVRRPKGKNEMLRPRCQKMTVSRWPCVLHPE